MSKYLSIAFFLFTGFLFGQTTYYVSVSGAGAHNGSNEANAFTLSEAISAASEGDIFYVKAGNYGSGSYTISANGSSLFPIKFIGYTSTINDISASNGSTFDYGDTVNSAVMPLLDASGTGTGITITGSYIELHNFQVKDYTLGIIVSGNNNTLNNVVAVDMGNQAVNNYDGWGIRFTGSYNTIKNSYIENATAEAFKVYGGTNNLIQYLEVRADNTTNPTDYYILLSNSSYNTVENSRVERAAGLAHGGHGLVMKWNSKYNTFRDCETKYTNIEFNFEDVQYNTLENIRMIGQGTSAAYWHTNIDFRNGANNNTVKNIYMTDVWCAFTFTDDNDGFVPSPDTDAVKCGYANNLYNIVVENVDIVFQGTGNTTIGGSLSAPMNDNIFDGLTVINYGKIGTHYTPNSGNIIRNSAFQNHTGYYGINTANGNSNNTTITTSNFDGALGAGHSTYSQTTHASGFTGTGTGADRFKLSAGSSLIDIGSTTSNTSDYDGAIRPSGAAFDIGAFEYSSGGADVTAPVVTNITVDNISTTSFRVDWSLNEGSKGRIRFGTTSGSYTDSTATENSYLTRHMQTVGPGNPAALEPGRTYYWQIYTEDSSGNSGYSTEQSTVTIGNIDNPNAPTLGIRSRFLKRKRF